MAEYVKLSDAHLELWVDLSAKLYVFSTETPPGTEPREKATAYIKIKALERELIEVYNLDPRRHFTVGPTGHVFYTDDRGEWASRKYS